MVALGLFVGEFNVQHSIKRLRLLCGEAKEICCVQEPCSRSRCYCVASTPGAVAGRLTNVKRACLMTGPDVTTRQPHNSRMSWKPAGLYRISTGPNRRSLGWRKT